MYAVQTSENWMDPLNVACEGCDEPMQGIRDYSIRKKCHSCGGHSLICEPVEQPDGVDTRPEEHSAEVAVI